MNRPFKIFLLLFAILWPVFSMANGNIPTQLKTKLEQTKGKEKLQVWEEWYAPYFYKEPKLWRINLDEACATAQEVLSKDDAIRWCMDLHLNLQEKYFLIGSRNRSNDVLNKAKILIEKNTPETLLKKELLKSWLIAKGGHEFLKYEKTDSASVYFEQALNINAGIEDGKLNFRLYKEGLEMFLASEKYSNAQSFIKKIKESQWDLSELEQLEIDFLELSVKNNLRLQEVTEEDYLLLLASPVSRDSLLDLKIHLGQASYLYLNNQFEKAEILLLKIDKELKKFNIYLLRESYHKTYARVLSKMGRLKDSRKQISLLRTVILDEGSRETTQIVKEQKDAFETSQKIKQINIAKKEKELRQASYIKQIAYLIGIGSFPIGLLLFMFVKNKSKRQELALLKKRDEAINVDRRRLFSSISAEIKKPLDMMIAPMERAVKSIGDKEAIGDIQLAQRNGQRLMELIDQIQDWNNLETRVLKINLEKGLLFEKLNNITQRFAAQAEDKGLVFESILNIEKTNYEMDFEKVNRIISNLLSNAVKFCEPLQKVEFLVDEINNGSDLKFTIQDNGPGISRDDQTKLFDQHFQGEQGQIKGGTGIGLATVKEMVELMKGKISFESSLGKGTSFYVEIPTQKIKSRVAISKIQQPTSDKPILLLVEDEADLLNFLKSELSKKYEILIAQNTEEGFALAEQHIPDLILSDWNLPDHTGAWLCKQINQNTLTNHIPVMILTGLSNADHLQEVFDAGAIARMEKPFKLDALLFQIKNILLQEEKIKIRWAQTEEQPNLSVDKPLSFTEQIQQIIQENLSDEYFTVEKMAEILMISRIQLFRKLKNTTGKSPSLLLKEARFEKSRFLLQSTDQTIAEIAYSVGYSDPNNFSTAYKKHFKTSPSAERST